MLASLTSTCRCPLVSERSLATENPKQQAARAAVQQVAVRDELVRHIRRRQLVDKLAGARARREAALRLTANRLHEQRVVSAALRRAGLERLVSECNAVLCTDMRM